MKKCASKIFIYLFKGLSDIANVEGFVFSYNVAKTLLSSQIKKITGRAVMLMTFDVSFCSLLCSYT